MFIALLWCSFFGATICFGVPDGPSYTKQQELNDGLGKAILQELGLKHLPKVTKEQLEKVPQYMIDLYNKRVRESESKGEERTDNTNQEFENRALLPGKKKIDYCHRERMFVDFEKIYGEDSDFIISPAGYSAYNCTGYCPTILGSHMNATNHAVVQSLMHLLDKTVSRPCCVPTKLSKISVLYFDDNGKVQKKDFKNMVVEAYVWMPLSRGSCRCDVFHPCNFLDLRPSVTYKYVTLKSI